MSTKAKLTTIVAILWVAAVVAISVAFYASRGTEYHSLECSAAFGTKNWEGCLRLHPNTRYFAWGGWLAWTGTVTLVAVVAIAIIAVVFRRKEA